MNNIILVGYRGTGKTTIAALLAERLGLPWLDADRFLEERFGTSIREIFAREGEVGFRSKENEVLEEICQRKDHVIATGGGVVLQARNRERLRKAGSVVWLTSGPKTIWKRLQGDESTAERRPDLGQGGQEEVTEFLRIREPFYRECAHYQVDTETLSPIEAAAAIATLLNCGS